MPRSYDPVAIMVPAPSPPPVLELFARDSSTSTRPPVYKVIGLILAISSGLFIGTSFVLKKIGLLKANVKYNEAAGEGYGYLKNAWWWTGMTLMIIGEICNFVAYAFTDAILVTPMGALSVVVTTILSAIFLKERLSFVGKVGCFNCIVGSVVIVLNAPSQSTVSNIHEMKDFVIAPGFLSYAGVVILGCMFLAFWAGPRYGKKSMLVYISICSLIGGLSVVATQGLGAAIVTQIAGTPQFNYWFLYVLLVFVAATLVTEIIFLNKALNIFNAALVTPTYYVYFTSSTIITSVVLFRGLKGGTAQSITTIVMGFLQICAGVVLLQLSKSAKDVPDAAVFKGDLDQIRTVAEQEEYESEPKADAIRGAAALVRSISKARLRKEVEEAKRIQEERLEPIGENEQVEWDGLRRRKTVTSTSISDISARRERAPHPPLGMAYFPTETEDDNHSHNPEDDVGIIPNIRKRTLSILHPRRSGSTSLQEFTPASHNVHLAEMRGAPPFPTDGTHPIDHEFGNPQHQAYRLTPELKRTTTLGLSGLQNQDTTYKSPGASSIQWADTTNLAATGYDSSQPIPRTTSPSNIKPGYTASYRPPAPPPHTYATSDQGAKRQFSFQHVFSRRRDEERSASGSSTTQSIRGPGSIVLGRKGRGVATPTPTEEERLGLVQGDGRNESASGSRAVLRGGRDDDDDDDGGRLSEDGEELGSDDGTPDELGVQKRREGTGRGGYVYDDDDDEFDDALVGGDGYARVRRDFEDDRGNGKAFV